MFPRHKYVSHYHFLHSYNAGYSTTAAEVEGIFSSSHTELLGNLLDLALVH